MENETKYITIENGQEVLAFLDVNQPLLKEYAKQNKLTWKRLGIKKPNGKIYYYDWYYQRVKREPTQTELRKHFGKKNNNYEKTVQFKKVSEVTRELGIEFSRAILENGFATYYSKTDQIIIKEEHFNQLCDKFYGLRNIAILEI